MKKRQFRIKPIIHFSLHQDEKFKKRGIDQVIGPGKIQNHYAPQCMIVVNIVLKNLKAMHFKL